MLNPEEDLDPMMGDPQPGVDPLDPLPPLATVSLKEEGDGEDLHLPQQEHQPVLQAADEPEDLQEKFILLQQENERLKSEAQDKDVQFSSLETECGDLKAKLVDLESAHKAAILEQEKKFQQMTEETGNKITELKKHYIAANKEKESMVVKYAMGEKEVIVQRKGREEAEKKLQLTTKEKDEALNKIKTLTAERNRLQQIGDVRYQDIVVLRRDAERWKEEAKIQESKASAAAGRLKNETDAHRETRNSLDATIKQLSETRQEIEKTRDECQDFMRKFKEDENARNRKAQTNAKEERVKLMIDEAAASELEAFRNKYKSVVDENNALSIKVQKFEKDRLDYDANLSKLKETVAGQKQEIVDLMAQVAEMESLRMQLQRVEERSEERSTEVERLRSEAVELMADMAACRRKEAELLNFTQKLTDKNVTLQSDLACLESKTSTLDSDYKRLTAKLSDCEDQLKTSLKELDEEKSKRKQETEILAKKLAELSKQAEVASQKMTDAENEVIVLKRKHASSLRELTRELQSCKKQLDVNNLDTGSRMQRRSPSALSSSSRASSNTSLNRISDDLGFDNLKAQNNNTLSVINGSTEKSKDTTIELSLKIPDSQILVEKIVKLQGNLARKQEKVDFLEDHIATLVEEMKKKNRLIQHYILQEETGALTSASMDENKARASAHGGIMASLYSSKQSDTGMTLDLSLEINQKLQAVLEETLLKNITLKENINTLGNEIATLSCRGSSKK